ERHGERKQTSHRHKGEKRTRRRKAPKQDPTLPLPPPPPGGGKPPPATPPYPLPLRPSASSAVESGFIAQRPLYREAGSKPRRRSAHAVLGRKPPRAGLRVSSLF